MKYGLCFLKPRLAPFIMKLDFPWFSFYSNTDSFLQYIFFFSSKVKPAHCVFKGWEESTGEHLTQRHSGPVHMCVCSDIPVPHVAVFHKHKRFKTCEHYLSYIQFQESSCVYIFFMMSMRYQTLCPLTAE